MSECVSGEVGVEVYIYLQLHMGIYVSVVASETVCMGCDEMS